MVLDYIFVLAVIGFLLSLYFYFVGRRLLVDRNYRAGCDLSEGVSCTKVASSDYSKMFGFSNALIGIGFYLIVLLLAWFSIYNWLFWLELFASLFSVYLIYLMFRIRLLCVVCVGIHVVNFLLLWLSYVRVFG
ncbi:hypothetical protein CMI38_05380 [Candidatus Pacearchaeota archaeon]|nr:hypothetical protein [Candidatus Pacearchaeota archaeon]|tara:strand:- start:3480 stop:3878 length:399 start_codon:yes stop_codon:yes gene_type:complete